MAKEMVKIQPVYPWDLWQVSRMSYANMIGVDPQFAALAHRRWLGPLSRLFFPFYLLLSGRGRKAMIADQIAGYAFLHLRRLSGLVFNVSVNQPFRRQGVAKMLLHDIHDIVRQNKRPWVALQVDWHNTPARTLYEQCGYQAVNPYVWQGTLAHSRAASEAAIERLSAGIGRDFYRHYSHIEVDNGEGWAAAVLKSEYSELPQGGHYWRCLWDQREVGCAWSSHTAEGPFLRLLFTPEFWSQPEPTTALLRLLAPPPAQTMRVQLGSSGHHAQATELLRQAGFQETEKGRLLMLKRVNS